MAAEKALKPEFSPGTCCLLQALQRICLCFQKAHSMSSKQDQNGGHDIILAVGDEKLQISHLEAVAELRRLKRSKSILRLVATCLNDTCLATDEEADFSRFRSTLVKHDILIRSKLGEGSFGKVFSAFMVKDLKTKTPSVKEVAVKIVEHSQSLCLKHKEPAELRIWEQLSHKNLLQLLQYFPDSFHRFDFYVSDYLGGPNLKTYLNRQATPFPESRASFFVAQICLGVRYLHQRRIAHRDIKLANIFVTKTADRLVIGDFGSAIQLSEKDGDTLRDDPIGSKEYMPPEVAVKFQLHRAAQVYSPFKMDVWAIGVATYHLLTKRWPFQINDLVESFNTSSVSAVSYWKGVRVSKNAKTFCDRIFVIPFQQRPSIDQVMSSDWLLNYQVEFESD